MGLKGEETSAQGRSSRWPTHRTGVVSTSPLELDPISSHGVRDQEELAHQGHLGQQRLLAALAQALVERTKPRIAAPRRLRRHEQRTAQVDVASFRDPRGMTHGSP